MDENSNYICCVCFYAFGHGNGFCTVGCPYGIFAGSTWDLRSKYELQTTNGMQRFQVRNARVSLEGKVLPLMAYKAEIDLSDEGSIKMLDAYVRFAPGSAWNVTMGQMRVPFTIDAHRSPHQQYFANRSFIVKQVGNVRDVGVTGAFFQKISFLGRYDRMGDHSDGYANEHGRLDVTDYSRQRVSFVLFVEALLAEMGVYKTALNFTYFLGLGIVWW